MLDIFFRERIIGAPYPRTDRENHACLFFGTPCDCGRRLPYPEMPSINLVAADGS